jgi:signal transduction histidine kinase
MPLAGRFVVQSVSALLVVGLIALIGIVAMTIWLNERSRVYFEESVSARTVRSAGVELRSAVQTAESSERGYVLTGNEVYLSPYGTAKTEAFRRLDLLRQRTDVAGLPPVLPRLGEVVTQKFDDMDRLIALKQERKDAEALAIIRTNRGKLMMDEINLFVSGIVRAADERVSAGVIEQRNNASRVRLASIAASLLIVLVVAGVLITIYRYTREITGARDQVNALNASLESRVAARTAELERANGEIQRFAHIVSHDLRAPLVNIVGFASEMESGLATLQAFVRAAPAGPAGAQVKAIAEEDMPEALGFIRSSTRKMDGLIHAILRISREGQRRLQPEPIDLSDVIETTRAAIHHQLTEAGGECSMDLAVARLVTDRLSLEQIVGNLMDNAVKYRSKDRPLRIAVRSRHAGPDRLRLEISDNGRGIAERDIGRVFELFKRSGTQDQPGEGVGLAFVQAVARKLGGIVEVTSREGHGTTFSVVLPLDLRNVEYGSAA